jgi:hypothetical protein
VIYTITLRNGPWGAYDITREASSVAAAKRIASKERAALGRDWTALLYATSDDGALDPIAVRTWRGWTSCALPKDAEEIVRREASAGDTIEARRA